MELEEYLRIKIKEYDKKKEELDKEWESLHDLKPKDMDNLDFQRMIQKARYETNPKNLDNEMINSFERQDPIKVKEWIHKGADKFKLYEYDKKINKDSWNRTMIQQWLLEDLYNIKEEKHFPYEHDKDISDPKTITTEEFNKLLEKYEKGEEFAVEEEGRFLIVHDDKTYTAIDNTYGNLFTEDFKDRNMALRYLAGEDLDKLREEECKYEANIYETPEDYDKGEPFQLNVYSNLEEAIKELNQTMNLNGFFAGNVINQETGQEEYANISKQNEIDLDDEEDFEV